MKIVFYASDKPRERNLAAAFCFGVMQQKALGVNERYTARIRSLDGVIEYSDLACVFGVKSKALVNRLTEKGIPYLYFDKGYKREKVDGWCEYTRVSYNAHNPYDTLLNKEYDGERFRRLGYSVKKWRETGEHILLAGSSAKYHAWYGLDHPTKWADDVVKAIKKITDRPIVYRPKPSWSEATNIRGTTRSNRPLADDFKNCYAVITHGSNICFDAMLHGIPCITLGPAIARHISGTNVNSLAKLRYGDRSILEALAYHQWTLEEFRSGEAFKTIRGWL